MRLRDVINFLRGLQTILKNNRLRYNEYYDIQNVYDSLYSDSKNGNKFYKLMEIILSKNNIRLAYRNIKTNKGSKTPGTDGKTIKDISDIDDKTLINEVRRKPYKYKPQSVKRVLITKIGTNKTRLQVLI